MPDLPSAEAKRRILHDPKASPESLADLADDYLRAGRLGETLEMLTITGDETRLRKLREHAIAHGEAFVLTQTERLLKDQASARDWLATAEKALADARYRQATTAFERAGDPARAAEAEAKIPAAPPCRPEKAAKGD